jgi:hypothetical protein
MHQYNESLTRITYDCGYYDLAHFNREFKAYIYKDGTTTRCHHSYVQKAGGKNYKRNAMGVRAVCFLKKLEKWASSSNPSV